VNVRVCAEEAVRRETMDAADLRVEIASDFFVAADSELLVRALSNLVRNACRHAAAAGPILIRAAREGEEIAITVSDCGPGVPEEALPKIFDAFYRVDTSRTRDTGGQRPRPRDRQNLHRFLLRHRHRAQPAATRSRSDHSFACGAGDAGKEYVIRVAKSSRELSCLRAWSLEMSRSG
jgi:hypothetical protein